MDKREQRTKDELMILEALIKAIDRREEVFNAIGNAENALEARHHVAQLLGVDENASRAVLDMQARKFTRDQRRIISFHAEELRSKLQRSHGTDS